MFICKLCFGQSEPLEKPKVVVLERREVEHLSPPDKEGTRYVEGVGTQIVREVQACVDCAALRAGLRKEDN